MKTSIKSIDIGFSVKTLKMPFCIKDDTTEVETDEGTITGTIEEICKRLVALGYSIIREKAHAMIHREGTRHET